MTVRELITKLEQWPDDTVVVIDDDQLPIKGVEERLENSYTDVVCIWTYL